MVKVPQVQNLNGVYLIDSKHNGNTGTIGVFLVPSKAKDGTFLLVETGPTSTLTNTKEHFSKVDKANRTWAEEVLKGMQSGEDDASLAKRIRAISLTELEADGASSDIIHRHKVISSDEMTVAGLKRYWLKHPDNYF